MLEGCCLNTKGRSAEDVAEWVFMFVYSGAALEQRGSRETGGENARSRWKAATKEPCALQPQYAMGGMPSIPVHLSDSQAQAVIQRIETPTSSLAAHVDDTS